MNVEAGSRDTTIGRHAQASPIVYYRMPLYNIFTQLLLLLNGLREGICGCKFFLGGGGNGGASVTQKGCVRTRARGSRPVEKRKTRAGGRVAKRNNVWLQRCQHGVSVCVCVSLSLCACLRVCASVCRTGIRVLLHKESKENVSRETKRRGTTALFTL